MNLSREHILHLRDILHEAVKSLDDTVAKDASELFPAWKPDTDYVKDNRVQDEGLLYKLIPDAHHSQEDWPPHLTPAIWMRVDDSAEEWPEWIQPTGAHDAYAYMAKVSHNGHHWTSDLADNVYEPGVYGWTVAD